MQKVKLVFNKTAYKTKPSYLKCFEMEQKLALPPMLRPYAQLLLTNLQWIHERKWIPAFSKDIEAGQSVSFIIHIPWHLWFLLASFLTYILGLFFMFWQFCLREKSIPFSYGTITEQTKGPLLFWRKSTVNTSLAQPDLGLFLFLFYYGILSNRVLT